MQWYFGNLSVRPCSSVRWHTICAVSKSVSGNTVMKKSVLKAAAVAGFSILGASGAFAQTATQTIGLSAFVNAKCLIGTSVATQSATGVAADNIVVTTSGTTHTGANFTPSVSGGNYSVTCTTPNTITMTSANDGLKAATPLGGAFDNFITYSATASQGVLTGTLNAAGTTPGRTITTVATPVAFNGTMTVNVATNSNVNPLAPGSYADTLTITLTPQ